MPRFLPPVRFGVKPTHRANPSQKSVHPPRQKHVGTALCNATVLVGTLLVLGFGYWLSTQELLPAVLEAKAQAETRIPMPDASPLKVSQTTVAAPQIWAAEAVKQGEVLKITVPGNTLAEGITSLKATFANHSVSLFRQTDGNWKGLMPVYVGVNPGTYTLKLLDGSGHELASTVKKVTDAHYSKQNIQVSKSMGGLQPLPGELETVAKLKTTLTPTRHWDDTPFVAPTPDCMNSRFGNLRYHNGKFSDEYHKGIDTRSPAGRPVQAIHAGKVTLSKPYRLHGNTVGLDHGQGITSIYIHLSKRMVTEGQMVKKGETLGLVGSTGFATGPHLHMGLFVNGTPVNPLQWFSIRGC